MDYLTTNIIMSKEKWHRQAKNPAKHSLGSKDMKIFMGSLFATEHSDNIRGFYFY
jgi:hypothetical protein